MLEIRNLTKTYKGGKRAVDNLSLQVEAGDICGFIGHNGAGKTTAIKCIVGIHGFDQGEIKVDSVSVRANPMYCKSVLAYVPDNPDLYEYLTGIQYLNFMADIFGIPEDVRQKRIEKEASDLGLLAALGDLISSYSHGMKQKVALIGALVHHPKLLVLDEPFVGLDPKASAVLKQCMRDLCQEGSAIFFSTHVLEVAEKLCDKIGMLDHGNLVVSGKVAELTKEESLEEVFLRNLEDAHE